MTLEWSSVLLESNRKIIRVPLREIYIDPLVKGKTKAEDKKKWFLPAPEIEKDLKMRFVLYTKGFDDVDFSEGVFLRGLFSLEVQLGESPDHPGLNYVQLRLFDKRQDITDPEGLVNVKRKLVITYMESIITPERISRAGNLIFPLPDDIKLYAGRYVRMESDPRKGDDWYELYLNVYYAFLTKVGTVGHAYIMQRDMKTKSLVDVLTDPEIVFMI